MIVIQPKHHSTSQNTSQKLLSALLCGEYAPGLLLTDAVANCYESQTQKQYKEFGQFSK